MTVNKVPTEWAMLQSFLLGAYNRKVRESFREDIDIDAGEWDTWTNEQRLLYLFQIRSNDTANNCIIKMLLFWFLREEYTDQPVFGIPDKQFQEQVRYRPQVILHFREKPSDSKANRRTKNPLRMRISFRILDIEPEQITQTFVNQISNEIKVLFPSTYFLPTGREKWSYTDKENGYQFSIPAFTEGDAKELIQKILALRNHTPDWDRLGHSTTKRNYAQVERKFYALEGQSVTLPQRRRIGRVYLRQVEFAMWPLGTQVLLYRPLD